MVLIITALMDEGQWVRRAAARARGSVTVSAASTGEAIEFDSRYHSYNMPIE